MIAYDSKVIREFATELYRIADRIVVVTIVKYALAGAVIGAVAAAVSGIPILLGVIVLGGVTGFIGKSVGEEKACGLKLHAQLALCQVEIEANVSSVGQHSERKSVAGAV